MNTTENLSTTPLAAHNAPQIVLSHAQPHFLQELGLLAGVRRRTMGLELGLVVEALVAKRTLAALLVAHLRYKNDCVGAKRGGHTVHQV